MAPSLVLEKTILQITSATGKLSATLLLLLLCNVFYDVVMRYLFNDVSIGMQELEWHLYASLFLLGISYTLSRDSHVRVDLIYSQLSPKRQAVIDIVGTLLFLIPFALLISWYGVGFVAESYQLGESSGDPGGLPYRWIIKSMIPVSFILLIISSIGFMLKSWQRYQEDAQ
ncbi:MAG: TRAP transporter small permease subunit [Gammaproteobacteria bacterium]|jgi:TRAP-type mannitol/chloroaromatic compound transport system permease small subunit|nr:TRAP transporter small permease subunit [Gammaproteobacteria bacterium]MBT3488768.1 TRAP transporter small permease subunit [Gammaproteobacteria bacterium]MBT3719967.1 TRAP transporter small permease subunit [Gammaproteobacteria bacterium]MBT3845912.1 TRAP transporter small permease subunit [Gammaproteobacteria bacterium]MBT3893259.1 TRAP transporter small permease subunit [Gammaproteobacteria bacterium]